MARGISLHAVDVASGAPAAGMQVRIYRLEADTRELIAQGRLLAHGVLDHPVTQGEGVIAGTHEAHFDVGDWLRAREGNAQQRFQEVAVFRFEVLDVEQHYHLPLKFTAWGLALFRGA